MEDHRQIEIALKGAITAKQILIIDKTYTINNIQYIKNYLLLYISTNSPRYKCWKPAYYNDPLRVPMKDRDRIHFSGGFKSIRRDWMLQQKFAYGNCTNDGWTGFLRMMIGAGYQLDDDKLIVVVDVQCTRGSQLIKYIYLFQFRHLLYINF